MTKDHGLCNGDCSVDIAKCHKLLLLVIAEHIVLFDGVQRLFLTEQQHLTISTWVSAVHTPHLLLWPHLPLDANTLVLVALCGNHDISFIEHKHLNLLGVNELELNTPVQHCARGANNNMLLPKKKTKLTFIASDGILQFNIRVKLPHLWGHTQTLMIKHKEQFVKCSTF
uniref:Uncharacterized protein n=1 Tax=Paramormyrops kingsleyae TaxID=1676925 RepID=A0A3B3S3Z3_9TELE